MKTIIDTQFSEVLYDLTWNLANAEFGRQEPGDWFPDSRTRFNVVMTWATEFQTIHARTDWNAIDYMETIDSFFEQKLAHHRS